MRKATITAKQYAEFRNKLNEQLDRRFLFKKNGNNQPQTNPQMFRLVPFVNFDDLLARLGIGVEGHHEGMSLRQFLILTTILLQANKPIEHKYLRESFLALTYFMDSLKDMFNDTDELYEKEKFSDDVNRLNGLGFLFRQKIAARDYYQVRYEGMVLVNDDKQRAVEKRENLIADRIRMQKTQLDLRAQINSLLSRFAQDDEALVELKDLIGQLIVLSGDLGKSFNTPCDSGKILDAAEMFKGLAVMENENMQLGMKQLGLLVRINNFSQRHQKSQERTSASLQLPVSSLANNQNTVFYCLGQDLSNPRNASPGGNYVELAVDSIDSRSIDNNSDKNDARISLIR